MNRFTAGRGRISPWLWIPTLYIAEGLPYFAVNTLTVLMYVNMGVSLKEMAFYTGWLYLPWVIKPFWSPFVDLIGTKRNWTIIMQALMGVSMALIAFLLPSSFFFASTLAVFWLIAFFSATHDIAADGYYMLELDPHEQAAYVGIRSTFYRVASVIGQGGLVIMAGYLERRMGEISLAWASVFGVLSLFFLLVSLYNRWILPRPAADRPQTDKNAKSIAVEFCQTFVTFFRKPYVGSALAFMLLYRLPEALCIKLVQPFMVGARVTGGLALTTSEVGFINGSLGVIALLLGGIAGGIAISIGGLKKWLWPMALSLTLPCVFYCILAMLQPDNIMFISVAVSLEQFGYGFGFTAYMLYLIYFSQGESQTSHYAFCTAFMALGMMVPGMFAGWLHELLENITIFGSSSPQGYVNFFWLVVLSSIVTFIVCAHIKINPEFGRKKRD